nr:2-hydroxychromene-2-carboxylate isomerase [Falsiruegeria litorea]
MVTQVIDFYFDFGSPNAYLVHKVLPNLAQANNASVRYHPILLGGVFKATNNQSPMAAFANVKHKLAYQAIEIKRFVEHHKLTFHMNPFFPVVTLGIMRGAVFAQGKPWETTYRDAIFEAMWVHGQKLDDPSVIQDVLNEAGLPTQEILEATQDPDVKNTLVTATTSAVDRGVFGSPFMFVDDEPFFGKNALQDIEIYMK